MENWQLLQLASAQLVDDKQKFHFDTYTLGSAGGAYPKQTSPYPTQQPAPQYPG